MTPEFVSDNEKVNYTIELHSGNLIELNAWGPVNKVKALATFLNLWFDPDVFQSDLSVINHDNGYGTLSFLRKTQERI